MNTFELTFRLKKWLPEVLWPWVIAALRQETLIWEALHNDEFYSLALPESSPGNLPVQPETFTPAALVLRGLQLKITPDALRAEPLPPLEPDLLQAARRASESLARRNTRLQNTTVKVITPTLPQAVLTALALRERRRVTGGWQGITEELNLALDWRTPLAILYDLVPDPQDMVNILVNSPSHTPLAIHVLLSQPLSTDEHLAILTNLNTPYWPDVLHLLAQLRPVLANPLALHRMQSPQPETSFEPLKKLEQSFQYSETCLLAGEPARAMVLLQQAQNQARRIQAALVARVAMHILSPDQALTAWKEANALDPKHPTYQAELALNFLEAGQLSAAIEALHGMPVGTSFPSDDEASANCHPAWLYALARITAQQGDPTRARQFALQSLSALEAPKTDSPASRDGNDQDLSENLRKIWLTRLAKLLIELGLPADAVRAIQQALALQPNDPELLLLNGQALTLIDDPAQAATCYQLAVMLDAHQLDWRRKLAESLETAEQWIAALEERTALTASPANPTPLPTDWHALATCALHASQPECAIAACQQAITHNTEDGIAHALYGDALSQLDQLSGKKVSAEALSHYRQATLSAPSLARPWLALAEAMQADGLPEKSLEILRTATLAAPTAVDIHWALGESYLAAQAPTQALSAFQRALELDADNVDIVLRVGQILYQLGHLPQARQKLEPAYHQHPNNINLAYCYGRVLLESGEPGLALPALRIVIASAPTDAAPYVEMTRALLAVDQGFDRDSTASEALHAIEQALRIDPQHVEGRALLAEALLLTGNHSAALEAYHKALESDLLKDTTWRARLALGLSRAALALKQTETAIAALQETLQADPYNLSAYRLLTLAYQIAGLDKNAILTAQAALQLDPDDVELLLWYAETLTQIAEQPTIKNSSTHDLAMQLQSEAIGVLNRANQLASQRADILLRLARAQHLAGDMSGACKTLRQTVSADFASPDELRQAATLLRDTLDEASTAITGLERAVRLSQMGNNPALTASLLVDLAETHRRSGDHTAAIDTLDQALKLFPDEIDLYVLKMDRLLEIGQNDAVLTLLASTFVKWPEAQPLHHRAALAFRGRGLLIKALEHAEKAIDVASLPIEKCGDIVSERRSSLANDDQRVNLLPDPILAETKFPSATKLPQLLAAEIARAILETERARSYLTDQAIRESSEAACLRAELALDADEEIEAAEALTEALRQARPNDPPATQARLLALQARLTARRGDWEMALKTFNEACNTAQPPETDETLHQSDVGSPGKKIRPALQPSEALSLANAALDLTQWEPALQWIALAEAPGSAAFGNDVGNDVSAFPTEPFTHFCRARALALRAEFQRDCQLAQVITHAPGEAAISEAAQNEFERALEMVRQHIAKTVTQQLDESALQTGSDVTRRERENTNALSSAQHAMISCWQQRGQSAFETSHLRSRLPDITAISSDWRKPHAAMAYARMAQTDPTSGIDLAARPLAEAKPTEKPNPALQAIQIALSLWPDEPRWLALAGQLLAEQGDLPAAAGHLEQAIRLEPKQISHLLVLGQIYLRDITQPGRFKRALRLFERASRLAPELPESWINLARTYLQTGDTQQATLCAERAVTLNPQLAEIRLLQAEIALKAGDPRAAVEHARVAAELQPAEPEAALLMAHALEGLKRPQEAIACLEQALPEVSDPLVLQLEHLRLLSKFAGSKAALQTAAGLAQKYPAEPTVLAALADAQAQSGDDQAAITTARQALQILGFAANRENSLGNEEPTTARQTSVKPAHLHLLIGEIMSRAGQLDQAVHHLSEAIHLNPDWVEPYLVLGRTLQERRQYRQALQTYQKATTIAPSDYRPFYQAGVALKEAKDYEESETMLREAANLAPGDVSIRRQLAAVVALNLVHNRQRTIHSQPILIAEDDVVTNSPGAPGHP